jgi:hypothetical protein
VRGAYTYIEISIWLFKGALSYNKQPNQEKVVPDKLQSAFVGRETVSRRLMPRDALTATMLLLCILELVTGTALDPSSGFGTWEGRPRCAGGDVWG